VIRAGLYLLASGAIWMAEGFLFSYFLRFSAWQVVGMAVMYTGLFVAACVVLLRFARRYGTAQQDLALWRLLSLAPMLVAMVGSFLSLPLLLIIAALGRLS
jgi:hypothetical protein